MSEQERNKAIVYRFNKACLEQGDENVFDEIVHPSCINQTAPPQTVNTAQGMKDFIFNVVRPSIDDLTVEIYEQIAERDLVVTRKAFRGVHVGELFGIKPSGKSIMLPIIDIVRLKNGQYVEHWGMRDLRFLQQP
jgi:predicted ester cyclase